MTPGATVQSQGAPYAAQRTTVEPMRVAPGEPSPPRIVRPQDDAAMQSAAGVVQALQKALPGGKGLETHVVWDAGQADPAVKDDPEGWYDRNTGSVVLNAGRIFSGPQPARRMAEVYLHEVVGHHGVESIVDPDELAPLVRDVHRTMAAEGGDAGMASRQNIGADGQVRIGSHDYVTTDAVRRAYPGASDTEVALETIARAAEMGVKTGLVQRLVSTVKRALRAVGKKAGVDIGWSRGDILDLVRRAGKAAREGKTTVPDAQRAKAFSDAQGSNIAASRGDKRPVWRSALADAVEAATASKRPASDWITWVNALTSKGVKKEEIEWSGITDWLKLQPGKVSRDDVLNYLRQNGVKVEETVLSSNKEHLARLNDELEPHGWAVEDDMDGEVAFIDPEGELADYSELPRGIRDIVDRHSGQADGSARYGQYVLPGGENYRELLLRLPDTEESPGHESVHWDQRNVLAHIRFNERTDTEGKHVLFVEELQSDWAQEGKRNGFDGQEKVAEERGTKPVPRGPFVTKTESWVALALKRMIAWAAEHGFDKVAFTTGEQNAQRYDLSKQIDELMIERDGDNFSLAMKPVGQGYSQGGRWSGKVEQLPNVVGKEMANKVAAKPQGRSYISGIDLKVGGEGMQGFYDQIVPAVAKDVLRKLGGGTMGEVRFEPLPDVPGNGWTSTETPGPQKLAPTTQPGFDITPAMVKSAERGLPMFSRGAAERNDGSDKKGDEKKGASTWLSEKDMALLQAELDAAEGRQRHQPNIESAQIAGQEFKAVTADKIAALGLHAEDAFPRLEYGEQYHDDKTGYEIIDTTVVLNGEIREAQIVLLDNGFWAFPPELPGSGRALSWFGLSEANAKAYNRRIMASIELGRRGFDLLATVPAKSAQNVVRVWRRVAQVPGAFEFVAKIDRPGAPAGSVYEMQPQMQAISDSLLAGSGQRIIVGAPKRQGTTWFPIQIVDKKGRRHEAEMELSAQAGGGVRFVVHAAELEKGSGAGKPLYQVAQAVGDFYSAKINPDRVGLLGVNTYRRTEHMLSGAVRLGSAGPMQPGVGQRIYGWVANPKSSKEKDENFARIALAVQRNVGEFVPEFRVGDITYNLAKDEFMRRGENVDGLIDDILARPDVRAASISRSTLARAAITAQAVQGGDASKGVTAVKSSVLYSRGAAERTDQAREYTSGPLDWIMKKAGGTVVRDWITSPVLNRLTSAAAKIVPEKVRMGAEADYGLDERYLDRKIDKDAAVNRQVREAKKIIDGLADLDRAGSRVAYLWMNEKPDTELERQLLAALPEAERTKLAEMKRMVDELGRAAVDVGLLSQDSYERNKMAYLHRSYAKHEQSITGGMSSNRASTIRAETYKGRGIRENVSDDALVQHVEEIVPGDKLLRIEQLDSLGRVHARRYIKPDDPVPAGWRAEKVWEARFFDKPGKVGMWRDLTPEERQRLGEIDEVRFAFAKTTLAAVRDIENARFLKWVADNYASTDVPPEKLVKANENFLTVQTYRKDEWIEVPTTKVAGTAIPKYGALAGKTIPAVMWNDIRNRMALPESELGQLYQDVLRFWKVSKTALSPAVHMNNVMSNFIFADLANVGARDVVKSLRVLIAAKRGDAAAKSLWERYQDSGAEHGSFAAYELNEKVIEPVLRELENTEADELGGIRMAQIVSLAAHGQISEALKALGTKKVVRGAALPFKLMMATYQAEDGVFRLAKWMKDIEHGASDKEAGKAAREAFLNYDINAPWIQTMRRSALPFIAFSYRAIPKLLEAVRDQPWKVAKYYATFAAMNALGYALLGAAGNEDKERKLLAPELQGKMLGIFPRMIRLPWNDEHGSPMFLDIRRWIPAGDVFDLTGSHSVPPLPSWLTWGGPLSVFANLMANKDSFTGKDIVKQTDTTGEAAAKITDYLFKAAAPNLPLPGPGYVIPGTDTGQVQTYSWTAIVNAGTGKTDAFGRENDLTSATLSAFGVKAKAYPADAARLSVVQRFEQAQREIDANISADQRELARRGITRAEFDRRMARNVDKLKAAQQEARKALN